MRAILIDPFKRTIEAINLKDAELDTVREVISPGNRVWVQAYRLSPKHVGLIDEEGTMKDWDYQAFFQLANGQHIAGRMLVLDTRMTEQGEEWCASTLPTLVVTRVVRWVDPEDVKMPAPTITFVDAGSGKIEVVPLDGVQEYNYTTQPTKKGS